MQSQGRFPVLGFQQSETDGTGAIVGHVGVVDARGEGHGGSLEGVLFWEVDDKAEGAAGIGSSGRTGEDDVPFVDVGLRGEGDGHACWGIFGAVGEFLKEKGC